MEDIYGVIEVDLFGEDADSSDHPEVERFRKMLEEVADEYGCQLIYFHVQGGTVSFSFDSEALMAEIVKILENDDSQNKP